MNNLTWFQRWLGTQQSELFYVMSTPTIQVGKYLFIVNQRENSIEVGLVSLVWLWIGAWQKVFQNYKNNIFKNIL